MFPSRERASALLRRLAAAALLPLAAAGCSYHAEVCGLRPYFPDVTVGTYTDSLVFAEAGSLQPLLRWETFPRSSDLRNDKQGVIATARDVTYELRIWRVGDNVAMKIVYERKGLPAPRHRVEVRLEPDAEHFWSVRARFRAGEETRVIPWSFSKVPRIPGLNACILPGNIPQANYYRFRTPLEGTPE